MIYLERRQLTDRLRIFARKRNVAPELCRKYFMLERVLERLSQSEYHKNFIIKGGFLIGSMIGMENRTTKDIDATITGITLEKNQLSIIFNGILKDRSLDNIRFELVKIEEIRDEDFYPGYRLTVHYNLDGLTDNIKFDLTTGESIIPGVQSYKHQSILLDKTINFLAYPIEQVLSEKLHTIIERNVLTTRMRDFYDVYTLIKMHENAIDFVSLKHSFENTMHRRKAIVQPNEYQNVIEVLSVDKNLKKLWQLYQTNYSYAEDIAYEDTIQTIQYLIHYIQK